jgi:hypothetical protein
MFNPQNLNRYSYVGNRPINYKDPSGHLSCKHANAAPGDCEDRNITQIMKEDYGVTISSKWGDKEKSAVYSAVRKIGAKLAGIVGGTASEAFHTVFGNLEFENSSKLNRGACTGGDTGVYCDATADITDRFLIHELGHSIDKIYGYAGRLAIMGASIYTAWGAWVTGINNGVWERGLNGYPTNRSGLYGIPALYHGPGEWSDWNLNTDPKTGEYTGVAYTEEWADMFLNWVDGTFVGDAGIARNNWMTLQVSSMILP